MKTIYQKWTPSSSTQCKNGCCGVWSDPLEETEEIDIHGNRLQTRVQLCGWHRRYPNYLRLKK